MYHVYIEWYWCRNFDWCIHNLWGWCDPTVTKWVCTVFCKCIHQETTTQHHRNHITKCWPETQSVDPPAESHPWAPSSSLWRRPQTSWKIPETSPWDCLSQKPTLVEHLPLGVVLKLGWQKPTIGDNLEFWKTQFGISFGLRVVLFAWIYIYIYWYFISVWHVGMAIILGM